MKIGPIDFPEELVKAVRDRKLVVFAGAGVSMALPSGLPSFDGLTNRIAQGAMVPRLPNEPFDRYLGRLKDKGCEVHRLAVERLGHQTALPSEGHIQLLRLFAGPSSVKLTTTNFDPLFEDAAKIAWSNLPEIFNAPALPLGNDFHGIVHVHGSVNKSASLVLTDADFGRAYLTEGWARRFLLRLFEESVVLFVGYSHEDLVMDYIARAMPQAERGTRYALGISSDREKWERLGIQLIEYPQASKSDHSALYEGLKKLADHCSASLASKRLRIHQLVQEVPPHDPELEDYLQVAVREETTLRFFLEKAERPEWISWLERKGFLAQLFQVAPIDENARAIGWWIANRMAAKNQAEILGMVGRNGSQLNPEFWHQLTRGIGLGDGVPGAEISKWVVLFLGTLPKHTDDHSLLWLGEASGKAGHYLGSLEVFGTLASSKIKIKEGFNPFAEENEKRPLELEMATIGDHWNLQRLWTSWLKPHIALIADDAIALTYCILHERHKISSDWQKAELWGDKDSWGRSAIEPHGQNDHPDSVDAVIDAARDSIDLLGATDRSRFLAWRDVMAGSSSPLLRRLSIHATAESPLLTADEKVAWAISKRIHDPGTWHENFRLAQVSYSGLEGESRAALLQAIRAHTPSLNEGEDPVERLDGYRFKWMAWLQQADPSCEVVKAELTEILGRHPDWVPRDNLDFLHWHGSSTWVGDKSPWSSTELLAKPAEQWQELLETYKEEQDWRHSRRGLLIAIEQATETKPEWGFELAAGLTKDGKWTSDLWRGIFKTWASWNFPTDHCREAIRWIQRAELLSAQPKEIARLLTEIVKDGGRPDAKDLILEARDVARELWKHLDRNSEGEEPTDWLDHAIVTPGGIIAQFWLGALPLLKAAEADGDEVTRRGQFLADLALLLADTGAPGDEARPVIASQYRYLVGLDESWAREHLAPLFSSNNPRFFKQAWDGYLVWGQPGPLSFDHLSPAIMQALPKLGNELSKRRERFIEFFAVNTAHFWKKLPDHWIQKFFEVATSEDRTWFAIYLEHAIRNSAPEALNEFWENWLAPYWKDRLNGVPVPFDFSEAARMLDLIPEVEAHFDEAVELAVKMPTGRLEHPRIVWDLHDSELVGAHSDATAKLLLYILSCETPYGLHGVPDIVAKLESKLVDPLLRAALTEKLLEKGFSGLSA
jgi:hypothetical protein